MKNFIADPIKTDDVDNGVSTLDLVLIQKHLLQLQTLSSPYKLIAADINHDEKITAIDLIQLRKLILGVYDEFPSNDSWRFVDALYEFPIPTDPWVEIFPEDYEIPALNTNMSADFIGVKIGDVNGSVTANFESTTTEKRSTNPLEFVFEDRVVEKGENVHLMISSSNFKDISGMQFTLHHAGLLLETVESNKLEITSAHAARLTKDVTSVSWNEIDGAAITVKGDVVSIHFVASKRLRLSDVISLNSSHTEAEAYQLMTVDNKEHYDIIDVTIRAEEVVEIEEMLDFALYQNEPNPWSQLTTIMVNSEIASKASLSIKDAMGRIVMNREVEIIEGLNEIVLTKSDIVSSGMYFYTLTMDEVQLTKQMIKVE